MGLSGTHSPGVTALPIRVRMLFTRGLVLRPVHFGLWIVFAVSIVRPFVAERPDSQSGLSSPASTWSVPGQVVLGGLFPLHDSAPDRRSLREGRPEQLTCTSVILEGFQWAMTMLFAIREINMNTSILPNITLGYEVYDTCFSIPRTISVGLGFMRSDVCCVAGAESQYCPQAVIGPYASKVTDVLSMALGLFLIPQVSFGAGCNCFSNKKHFPSFVHTYHSYATLPLVYSHLVRYFSWTFIGIMAVEDIYNWDLMASLRTEVELHGYCVAFMEVLPQHYGLKELDSFGQVLLETKARVIILLWHYKDVIPFGEMYLRHNLTLRTWLGFIDTPLIKIPRYAPIYQGALGFEMRTGFVPDLQEFLNSLSPRQPPLTSKISMAYQLSGGRLESRHDLKRNDQECDLHGMSAFTQTIPSLEFIACCASLAASNNSHYHQLYTLKTNARERSGQHLTDSKIITRSSTQSNFSHGMLLTTEKDSQRLLPLDAWAEIFNCSWSAFNEARPRCTGAESLRETSSSFTDMSRFQYGFTTYLAVYTVAYALRDMRACSHGQGPFENGSCALPHGFEPWQLLLYIRNVRFTNSLGEEQWLDENGDPPPRYELVNVKMENRTSVLHVVGSFDLNKGLHVDLRKLWWNNERQKIPRSICSKPCIPGSRIVSLRGKPSCCFECVPCKSGEVSNITDSQECYQCPEGLWSNDKQDTCIPMHQEFLSFTEPLAIIMLTFALMGIVMSMAFMGLLYLTRFRLDVWMGNPAMSGTLIVSLSSCFIITILYVGKPTDSICLVREPLTIAFLALSLACLLALITTRDRGNSTTPLTICYVSLTLLEIMLCAAWAWLGKPHVIRNSKAQVIVMIECSRVASFVTCSLVLLTFMACLCLGMSIKINQYQKFHDFKFISFGLMFYLVASLAFISAYGSTQGKFAVATEMAAILAMSYDFLCCIFIPKFYVLFHKKR